MAKEFRAKISFVVDFFFLLFFPEVESFLQSFERSEVRKH